MNPWHKLPFLRLIIPLLAGILLGISGMLHFQGLVIVLGILLLFQYVMIRHHRSLFSYSFRWMPGVILNVFLFLTGGYLAYCKYVPNHTDYFGNYDNGNTKQQFLVKISGPLSVREKSIRTTGDIIYIFDNKLYKKTTGRINLSFEKCERALALAREDVIFLKTYLKDIPGPVVPCSFDYASFSARKGILYQVYLKQKDWKLLKQNNHLTIKQLAWECQQKLVGIIREQSMGKDEQAVGCAMLLGYTDGFGQDLQGAYSRAGVTHILSVSGLHVGLVFVIFSRLLFFLNKNRYQKALKTILLILLTWSYALLTGLAPCVQRAAFMFSFLIIGQNLQRKNNIVNTLFASAFILLWINPSNIFDFGFQLSYLAVLGIVWLEPLISPMLYIKHLWIDKIWKLTAVTLAAQIATGPLASYHFHQFPTWFIPANLIVIPLSTLVMYLGICLLAVSPIPLLNDLLRLGFSYSIKLMNYLIGFADKLPLTVIEGLYPSVTNVVLCFLFILCLAGWLATSSKIWVYFALTVLLTYSISLSINNIRKEHKRELAFFTLNKTECCAIHFEHSLHLFIPAKAPADTLLIKQKLKPWMLKQRINKVVWHSDTIFYKNKLNGLNNQIKILWVNQRKYPDKNMNINTNQIILGSNTTFKQKQEWINYGKLNHLPVADIKNKGCILLEW